MVRLNGIWRSRQQWHPLPQGFCEAELHPLADSNGFPEGSQSLELAQWSPEAGPSHDLASFHTPMASASFLAHIVLAVGVLMPP